MSTPNQSSNTQASGASGSAGPSTPAAAASLAPGTAAALAQNNASTPRSNASTKYPSPAAHYRSPAGVRSPAAARALGATPMARAASSNAASNAAASQPMRRGNTTGMKGLGTPGKGGKTVAGTGATGSPAANQASPLAGMTPGTAVSHSLGGFESPAMAGDMGLSLSNLGINIGTGMSQSGSAAGRIDEEERRRRLEAVLVTLGRKSGRISREAIERLGRRYELDMQMDEDELSLAGKNAVMLEVHFKPNKSPFVERVSVAFPTASDAMAAHADKASRILQDDLTPQKGIAAINASLDRFADNLERLARLDKLSIPGANCFEAVFGVYTSLKRLYEHEKRAVETLQSTGIDDSELDSDTVVLCTRCGRPQMHARRRVGLALEYWKPKSSISRPSLVKDSDAMDIDGAQTQPGSEDSDDGTASLIIECESSSPALYQTIRVTDEWLSERVEKPPEERDADDMATFANGNERVIEWQDPPPPLIPPVEPDSMSLNTTAAPTHSEARFVAKLEPPVVLPLQIAAQIYDLINVDIRQETLVSSTVDALVLPNISQAAPVNEPGEPKHIAVTRRVTAVDVAGNSTDHTWTTGLYLPRLEHMIQIERLPFSHPRQVVDMLPVLRQYTFLAKLLQNTFAPAETPPMAPSDSNGHAAVAKDGSRLNKEDTDVWNFLATPPKQSPRRHFDATLSTIPAPRIAVNIPSAMGLKTITLSIGPDGTVAVDTQDLVPSTGEADDGADNETAHKAELVKSALSKALLVAEDLGVWAEWVRGRFLE